MFGQPSERGVAVSPINVTRYVKDMTREERYEWDNYDMPPLERLETAIEVVRRGLQVDKQDKPGVEEDLIALELVSDEAQGIMNRSLLAGITIGLLGLAGGALLFSNGGKELGYLFYPQVCFPLPAAAIGIGMLATALSSQFIFEPMANRFVNNRVRF